MFAVNELALPYRNHREDHRYGGMPTPAPGTSEYALRSVPPLILMRIAGYVEPKFRIVLSILGRHLEMYSPNWNRGGVGPTTEKSQKLQFIFCNS